MSRQPFNTRWAQGVESEDNLNTFKYPGDVRLGTGWEGGQDKDAPPAGQENWWHNRVDSALQDLERQGAMTWHAQAIYGLGAPCYAADGYCYESLASNNANNNPISSSGYWRQIGQSLYSSSSVGEYKDVAHNGVPDAGWLKCTGALLLRSAYPKLFATIGVSYNSGGELSTQFRLPDWRGVFDRGLDDGRGLDPGRTLGILQGHALEIHSHYLPTGTSSTDQPAPNIPDANWNTTNSPNIILPNNMVAETLSVSGKSGNTGNYASETRPVNLAKVRWIRYL